MWLLCLLLLENSNLNMDEDADMDNQMCTLMRRAAELQHHVEAAAACGASQALARATAPSQDGVPAKILPNGPEAENVGSFHRGWCPGVVSRAWFPPRGECRTFMVDDASTSDS